MPKMKTLSRELLLAVIEAMAEVIKEVAFKPEYASISVHSDLWKWYYMFKLGAPGNATTPSGRGASSGAARFRMTP